MSINYNLEQQLKDQEYFLIKTYAKLETISFSSSEYEKWFDESIEIQNNISRLKREIRKQQEQEIEERIKRALKEKEEELNESWGVDYIALEIKYKETLKEKEEELRNFYHNREIEYEMEIDALKESFDKERKELEKDTEYWSSKYLTLAKEYQELKESFDKEKKELNENWNNYYSSLKENYSNLEEKYKKDVKNYQKEIASYKQYIKEMERVISVLKSQ
jgi:hypothetical protein